MRKASWDSAVHPASSAAAGGGGSSISSSSATTISNVGQLAAVLPGVEGPDL